ncbi:MULTISPECIES: TnsA-like heteromeric transposase endonuclease subunit [unclassified Streptomyces]|uniref:TnsA-like heteromeric transposase endonuclease subunit n=1 Tax=unclassified Streptomyces TaxID=2593676 RepID=UPI0035E37ECE
MPFEHALPVRAFASYRRQRNLPGLWWSATTGGHVGYESWLERDHVMLLDIDPAVVGITSQPFWLFWSAANGRAVSHAPDYFARRDDGMAVVIDCRPADRRGPRDVAKFEATAVACAEVGWEFRLLGAPEPVVVRNVRWLAGYRHPRHWVEPAASRLREVFAEPLPLMDGAAAAGEPLAVLPVLFHLLWSHELTVTCRCPCTAAPWSRRGRAGDRGRGLAAAAGRLADLLRR